MVPLHDFAGTTSWPRNSLLRGLTHQDPKHPVKSFKTPQMFQVYWKCNSPGPVNKIKWKKALSKGSNWESMWVQQRPNRPVWGIMKSVTTVSAKMWVNIVFSVNTKFMLCKPFAVASNDGRAAQSSDLITEEQIWEELNRRWKQSKV